MGNTQVCWKPEQNGIQVQKQQVKPETKSFKNFKPPTHLPGEETKRDRLVSSALNELLVSKEPITKYFVFGWIIGDGKFGTVWEAKHVDFPD